jgi:retinol dehydrogenase-12
MLDTVKRSPPGSVRVVHVSSSGHYLAKAQPLDFASFKGGPARNKYSSQEFYYQSKSVSE